MHGFLTKKFQDGDDLSIFTLFEIVLKFQSLVTLTFKLANHELVSVQTCY